ncbi:LAMI_0A07470g1_1 [Lachancea mirantina]|uniref:LAMI_0A07470g1_1 n=1 Tax=Lachancea mirantina TaxID=1230905 RepID=A0A1G4IQV7_9SACH|nr:LAMI_0A07470g1_1 [Lachancea mirantina]
MKTRRLTAAGTSHKTRKSLGLVRSGRVMDSGVSRTTPVTNFDVIESDKENILPLKNGRSAAALSNALQDKSEARSADRIAEKRLAFENRILTELEVLDDPLELYLEYIDWINTAYTQGPQTKQSGMVEVLERCLMYFKDIETYRNDPRYVRLWLCYVELFSSALQERQTIFVYMSRKQIGIKLTLFYEDFASLLVEMKDYAQARDVLTRGIEQNARPLQRLKKSLADFDDNMRVMNVKVPSIATGDGLLDQVESSVILGKGKDEIREDFVTAGSSLDQLHAKHQIFKDESEAHSMIMLRNEGWDLLEAKRFRDKENKKLAIPIRSSSNVGKMVQETPSVRPAERISVFRDDIGRSKPVYKIIESAGRKPEKIDCNFDIIFPSATQEFSFEEILAISRDIYQKRIKPANDNDRPTRSSASASSTQGNVSKRPKLALKEKTAIESIPAKESVGGKNETRTSSSGIQKITCTSVLPLNDEAHPGSSIPRKDKEKEPGSPTVTFFSKDAMNEVYSMFNQSYSEPKGHIDTDDTTSKFAVYENFTQEFTRKSMDDLTEVKDVAPEGGRVERTPLKKSQDKFHQVKDAVTPSYKSKLQEYMTPINERTESTIRMALDAETNDEDTRKSDFLGSITTESSPFLTQPQLQALPPADNNLVIPDPLSEKRREAMLSSIQPSLDTYGTFFSYSQCLKMSSLLKKIHKVSKSANKNPIIDFKKTNDLYCIRAELGEGGYATVYLAESSTGSLKALKVEKPASTWEFYILKQVETRLMGHKILESIINVSSLHCFQDESYLVLNYAHQGTVLDLISAEKGRSANALNEYLCMFITVELMKVLECIHDVGIIHGDLKADNCMIRFEDNGMPLGNYDPTGKNGWSSKGIYLIDFGRSFDLTLFPLGTRFKANWHTDQQDCPEMREGRPWTYEADYYGLAGIIHVMLFGKFIETKRISENRYAICGTLKRYWKQDLWAALFDILINSSNFDNLPITSRLREQRERLESCLQNEGSARLRSEIVNLQSDLSKFNR